VADVSALITGATGFIGGRLAARLRADGRTVHALVRPGADVQPLLDAGVVTFEGELADPNSIAQAAAGCEVVFHCAAEASHRADPAALAWVNVAGTENVINASRAADVPVVVLLSCADVTLENRDRLYAKESAAAAIRCFNALARTKLLGEELALQANSSGMGVVALRPAWVWGARDTTRLPGLVAEGLAGGMALFGGGDNLVATAHVDNVVDAMLLAQGAEGARGKALHIADSDTLSIREFLGAMSTALSLPSPRRGVYPLSYGAALLRRALSRPGPWPMDVVCRGRGRMLEVSSAAGAMGFSPRVGLDEGMAGLTAWAAELGGAEAIARLGRQPAGGSTATAHRRAADAAVADVDSPATTTSGGD